MHWTTSAPRAAVRVLRTASDGPAADRGAGPLEDPTPAATEMPLDVGPATPPSRDEGDDGGCDPGPEGPVLRLRRADRI